MARLALEQELGPSMEGSEQWLGVLKVTVKILRIARYNLLVCKVLGSVLSCVGSSVIASAQCVSFGH